MELQNVIDVLLSQASPSIRYRVKRDILQEPRTQAIDALYTEILREPGVEYAFSLQRQGGYPGEVFHSGFNPNGRYPGKPGVEGIVKYLLEKGISANDPRMTAGFEALRQENWLGQSKGIWCAYYPELGLYGPELIRTTLLASAGVANDEELRDGTREAVDVFERLRGVSSMEELTESMTSGGQTFAVFRPGVHFPEWYHLKLLAYSTLWRKGPERAAVIEGIKKLISFSPLPVVRVRLKSRWLAPAAIVLRDLKVNLSDLAAEGWDHPNWAAWFQTFELFARMGIVRDIPELERQAGQLREMLVAGNGFFAVKLPFSYFNNWSAYSGIALERDWRAGRGVYDLTFRSLLTLHMSGLLTCHPETCLRRTPGPSCG